MNWKKPRDFKVEDMLYADRCMLKWHGMLLSDHNERISSDEAAENLMMEAINFSQDELESWDNTINEAIAQKKKIKILIKKEGKPLEEILVFPLAVSGKHLEIRDQKKKMSVCTKEIICITMDD